MQRIVHSTFFNADILVGVIFRAMGLLIRSFPPRSRRSFYGYLSYLSTRNQHTWDEANLFAGKHSLRIAAVLIPLGLLFGFLFSEQDNWYYLLTVATVVIAAMNLRGETEWHLSRRFDQEGRPRALSPGEGIPSLPPRRQE